MRNVEQVDPGAAGGGIGFGLGLCITWMFEAEWRHARAADAVA